MSENLGKTSLKRRRRSTCPMFEYDRLPPELRDWLATAVLPWGPKSVRRAYDKAVARTQDKVRALEELDRIQDRLVARDAGKVWGDAHPSASGHAEARIASIRGRHRQFVAGTVDRPLRTM